AAPMDGGAAVGHDAGTRERDGGASDALVLARVIAVGVVEVLGRIVRELPRDQVVMPERVVLELDPRSRLQDEDGRPRVPPEDAVRERRRGHARSDDQQIRAGSAHGSSESGRYGGGSPGTLAPPK